MENKLINILQIFALITLIISSQACGKWDDVHKEFIGKGEINYTGKADSVRVRSGFHRLELSWLLISDPKVSSYKVFWNNRQDSVAKDVQRTNQTDTIRLMFENMKEGTYHFEIFTYDAEGNRSVKSEIVGKVYGDQFQKELLTRAFRSSLRSGKDRFIEWISPDEKLIGSDLIYKNSHGNEVRLFVGKKDQRTLLEDIPLGSSFKIRSSFLPDSVAIDTFYTEYETIHYEYTWVNFRDIRILFGFNGSIISVDKAGILRHAAEKKGSDPFSYNQAVQIGNGWNIFENVFPNRNTFIGWNKKASSIMRYNFDNAKLTFTDSKQIGNGGWETFNQIFTFQGDVIGRLSSNSKMYRYQLDLSENFSGKVWEITGHSWKEYTHLISSGKYIYGRTTDGKLWAIPIDNNSAGTRFVVDENWKDVVLISKSGENLLMKKNNAEVWQYPVSLNGKLGTPVQIKIPNGEKRRLN